MRATDCSVAFVLHPEHWRKGYATEASNAIITHLFERYGVAVARAEVSVRNEASIELVKRLGFAFVRHDAAEADDIYEVGRSAWLARRRAAGYFDGFQTNFPERSM